MSYQIARPKIRFDVQLLTQLNEEYAPHPIAPSPPSPARAAYIERGQTNGERIAKMFPVRGKRILEIGCGEGDVAEYLAKHHDCEVHGIDVQPHPIWQEHTHASFQLFDLSEAVAGEDRLGSFDYIYSYSAWEHVLHPFRLLQATRKRLRPDGKFYLSTALHRGPRASHLYRDLFFPWPHLLFSDDVIYDYYVSRGKPPRFPSWVNCLSIADYFNYFRLTDFEVEKITYTVTPFDEAFYERFQHWLARYPRFDLERDLLHAILVPARAKETTVHPTAAPTAAPVSNETAPRSSRAPVTAAAPAPPAATPQKRAEKLLSLSVDVEAQPVRAVGDPVQELIFGRFGGEDFGISRMMDIADAAGHKLTLYLDLCEYGLYGDALLDVAREITRRGHDFQVHAHADLLSRSFWSDRSMSVPPAMDRFPDSAAEALVAWLCELAERATGQRPRAFRGGAFRFNPAMLRALAKHGIPLSSNYYAGAKYWPVRQPHGRPFRWENGVLEVPVSTADVDGTFRYGIFENLGVDSRPTLEKFLNAVHEFESPLDVSTFVLHSWSLLKKDEAGKFSSPSEQNVARFQTFLSHLTTLGYRSTTTEQILGAAEGLPSLPKLSYGAVFESARSLPSATSAVPPPPPPKPAPSAATSVEAPERVASQPDQCCSVCGAARATFSDFFGRRAVRCEGCGSLERHRAFLQLCRTRFGAEWSPAGKDLLLISPNTGEERSLRALAKSVRTLEVREDIPADFHADICDAPVLDDRSFDAVVGHHVFAHVYDDRKAFSEVARILRPGGRLFLSTPLDPSGQTLEITDVAEISRLWGREVYDRYRVGTFRRYGERDLVGVLSSWFKVRVHQGVDAATGEIVPIVEAAREPAPL